MIKLISKQHIFLISQINMIQGIQFFNKDIAKRFQDNPDEILKWITQVQLSPTPLERAAYCEKVLMNEIRLGVKQYVILGAGMDTFCFRNDQLKTSLEIFEVDFPTTQEFKIEWLINAQLDIPNNLHFASMDFTKQFSETRLIKKGFKNQKTFLAFWEFHII